MITDLPTKAYLSDLTVTNISQSFYLQDGGKNQLAYIWNKITSLSPYIFSCVKIGHADTEVVDARWVELVCSGDANACVGVQSLRAKQTAVDESVVNRDSAGLSTTASRGQGRGGQGRDGSSSSSSAVARLFGNRTAVCRHSSQQRCQTANSSTTAQGRI